jgi:hypothetical protein
MKFFLLIIASLLCAPVFADTIYITEFQGAPPLSVYYQAVKTPALVTYAVTISGSSTQSTAFGSNTGVIRINTDAACHVVIGGSSPTATSSSMRMSAGQTEYFLVTPGQKLAVISGT